MSTYSNKYTQGILEVIKPVVGENMGQKLIRARFAAVGLKEESIEQKDLPRLAESLKQGLIIFLGSETANVLSSKVTQIQT